jgi:hypothetical protein
MRLCRCLILTLILFTTSVARASVPAPEGAAPPRHDEGLVLRAGGDMTLGPDEHAGAMVVLGGNAVVRGEAGALLVVGGNAQLDGARVGDVTVVGGQAELRHGATIGGDLRLVDATLLRDDDTRIGGAITHESAPRWGFFPFGFVFALGASLAVLLAGILAVAIAPVATERAAQVLRQEPGRSALAAALAFLVGPPVAVVSMVTIVGIPVGFGLLFFVLPALAFLGYLVAGYALGARVWQSARANEAEPRPFVATVIGLAVLMLLGILPVAGALVGLCASALGGGAIALTAWRALRHRGGRAGKPLVVEELRASGGPGGLPSQPAHP